MYLLMITNHNSYFIYSCCSSHFCILGSLIIWILKINSVLLTMLKDNCFFSSWEKVPEEPDEEVEGPHDLVKEISNEDEASDVLCRLTVHKLDVICIMVSKLCHVFH